MAHAQHDSCLTYGMGQIHPGHQLDADAAAVLCVTRVLYANHKRAGGSGLSVISERLSYFGAFSRKF